MELQSGDDLRGNVPPEMCAGFVVMEPVLTAVLAQTLLAAETSSTEVFSATPLPGTGTWRVILVAKSGPYSRVHQTKH